MWDYRYFCFMKKKLFVFDLDFTLWDAAGTWCDCTTPPYTRKNGSVIDGEGGEIVLYADVLDILDRLKSENILIASASRTSAPSIAKTLLNLFDIRHYFSFEEIYPSSKLKHFESIRELSGVDFFDMVFFDDEYRNIEEVRSLGVNCEYVSNGVSLGLIEKYL